MTPPPAPAVVAVGGPYYEDLHVGQRFDDAPGLTLTAGHAALHQAIAGDRLRLALDGDLAAQVLGPGPPLAHPGLVCDVAIGQSTSPTHRVIGNLFYRGLVLRAPSRIGDTLRTTTEVVALRDNAARPGRRPTGLAALRVRTVDQTGRPVLDFHRCAMLPMRSEQARPGHADDLDLIPDQLPPDQLVAAADGIDLARYRRLVGGAHGDAVVAGTRYELETGDTVSAAPELVRLTLNVAGAHSDPGASGRGRRLVYGGHTIGVAFAHLTRALPNLVTVAGWRSCDHLAPVFEGDVLHSVIIVEAVTAAAGAALIDVRIQTAAARAESGSETAEPAGGAAEPVLDWRLVAVMAP
jgi:acyl dehydratase